MVLPATRPRASPVGPVRLSGWGGGPGTSATLLRPSDAESLHASVTHWRGLPARGAIARGMGRSYGDAAQLDSGLVIDTTRLKRFELDPSSGVVRCEAGVTIGELLEATVPHGWIVPVVPGTQHVTAGGAIASDIHGKNHGTAGTFGRYVQSLGLLTSSGDLLELEPGASDGLFEATVGGMGLTGIIVWAQIRLRAIHSPRLSVDTDRAANLDDALAMLSVAGGPHRVAWLDLLGRRPGRGIVTRAEHLGAAEAGAGSAATVRARATVPRGWPGWLLRPGTVAAFNEVRFRRAPRRERERIEAFGTHMFPLDVLAEWPRLYGRMGFVQYQPAVPRDRTDVLERIIEQLRRARVPVFLAILKDFGPASPAPLSFPIEGWTLALDLPRAASGLAAALERCDELVADAGGRVYLTKDSRIREDALRRMYPRLDEWRATRDSVDPDGLWRSDLALRSGLVGP